MALSCDRAECPHCGRSVDLRNFSRHVRTHGDPRARWRVPSEQQDAMIAMYGRGLTIAEISAQTFWSSTEVHRVLTSNGVQMRPQLPRRSPQRISTDEVLRRCELYGRGYSLEEVAVICGVSRSAIVFTLQRAGTPTRSLSEANRLARQRHPERWEAA